MHDVERELIKVTKYKVKRKFDNRQDYLGSILNAAAKLSQEEFDDLTQEAADWVNAAADAKNNKEPELPDFDEVEVVDEEGNELTPDEADEPEGDDESEESEEDEDDDSEFDDDDEDDSDEDEEPDEEDNGEDIEGTVLLPAVQEKHKGEVAPPPPNPAKKLPSKVTAKVKNEAAVRHGKAVEIGLDKWGCMEGTKNSQALALFEKGTTAKEVKEALGGTFYNVLARVQKAGHRVEKEGNLIKLSFVGEDPGPRKSSRVKKVK